MAEFRWIIMSSFLMLLFSSREAAGQYSYVTVRVGDEATLPCENVKQDQNKCDKTSWLVSDLSNTVTLVDRGQIHKDKSDRLSVTEQCSLVIKKVTEQDVGLYDCKQIRSERSDYVFLSVVSMTEQKEADTVSLLCSVDVHGRCRHTMKWLHEGKDVTDNKTSQRNCSARATFTTADFNLKSKNESLKCEATNDNIGEMYLFPFSPPQSSEKPGWWSFIYVPLGLAALITTVVAVNMWTRTKGNRTQMEENTQHNDEDEDEGTVTYENVGEPSVSVRLH